MLSSPDLKLTTGVSISSLAVNLRVILSPGIASVASYRLSDEIFT